MKQQERYYYKNDYQEIEIIINIFSILLIRFFISINNSK